MKAKSGFTLIEIMIVLGIISILSAMSIPNMIAWRSNQQLSSFTREILSTIQHIRLRSIKESATSQIQYDSVNHQFDISSFVRTGLTDNKSINIPSDIVVDYGSSNTISYNNRGLLQGLTQVTTWKFTNTRGTSLRIVVALSGNPRIR